MGKHKKPKSHHAVGASLNPDQMADYISGWNTEQGQRWDAWNKWMQAEAADPAARKAIAANYAKSRESRVSSLAARGLSAGGFNASDILDLDRARITQEYAQAAKLKTARDSYTATIGNLNKQRTNADLAASAQAGANIHKGTGKFKHEKPKGWKPPNLAGAGPTNPNTATAGKSPATPTPATPPPVVGVNKPPPTVVNAPTAPRPNTGTGKKNPWKKPPRLAPLSSRVVRIA